MKALLSKSSMGATPSRVRIPPSPPSFDRLRIAMYNIYILECDNAFFYVGLTTNLETRLLQHQKHQSSYTKRYGEVQIVYSEKFTKRVDAAKREKQLKGWSKAKKKALIVGDVELLKKLSRSKS